MYIKYKLSLPGIITMLISFHANACDCRELIDEDNSSVVFKGIVLKVKQIDKTSDYKITFRVKEKIKGDIKTKRLITYTPCLDEACCGISFQKGEYYYVVTKEISGKLYSYLCTTTRRIKN